MTDPTISLSEVSKWFGPKVAVSEVSLGFGPGVTGLLGPNGAGKTTLMRLITGLQTPSAGEITVLGQHPRRDTDLYRRIALVPEDESVYTHMSARRFITVSARLAKVGAPAEATERVLDTVGLTDAADRDLGGFSKGMRQRAKVAAALVSDPEVLVLDEPLNGADPVQRAALMELFRKLGAEGRTVVVSSHVLAEVERMAPRIVAMVDGRLAAVGTVADLRTAMTDRPRLVTVATDEARQLASRLVALTGVDGVRVGDGTVQVEATDAVGLAKALPRIATDHGITLRRVEPTDDSLESVFRYLVDKR